MEKIGLGKNEGNIEKHLTEFFGDKGPVLREQE